ncbi:MAG TPA: 30S ribosomal protein S12 methylthiotransferase RimO [Thermoanaerobaculales bacterium]|nr:30S ribosomal protein S12 methylthiotransferase RimO [Thermoanaerobaculales bacterium]
MKVRPAALADRAPTEVRVGMISLGCAKNLVDGEVMLGHLARAGARITADAADADVIVVNTCGFIDDAKRESIEAILEVAGGKRRGRVRRLIVAGCMAQAYARELAAEIPEIDTFVGLDELERVVEAVRGELPGHLPDQSGALRLYDHLHPRIVSTAGYAYLKVAEGCDNPCSFCHIPAMRGRFRSRPQDDLVAEARGLEGQGVRELILIAQDTTRYGEDLGLRRGGLRQLVTRLLDETSLPWIRFLYAYPATLDEGLLELMAANPRFLAYLDIPLQHCNRRVLKAMRRGGDGDSYLGLIGRARAGVPSLTLRTTMIVGFPGEGEPEFEELLDFVAAARFDHLGVFCYSWQEENPGAALGDPVSPEVKAERRDRLLAVQQGISLEHNRALVGRAMPAIVAGPLPEMELLTEGRLQRQAPEIDGRLLINDGTAPPGSLVEVEITDAHPYDVVGRLVAVTDCPRPRAVPTLPVRV